MADLVKTTITLPEELLEKAKMVAIREKTTLSGLMRQTLEAKIMHRRGKLVKDPMRLAGIFKLGIKKIYNKRSDLYDDHIFRKMGY